MKDFYKYLIVYIVLYASLIVSGFIVSELTELQAIDGTWAAIWCLGITLFLGIQDIIDEIKRLK